MDKKDILIRRKGATLLLKITLFAMGIIVILLSIFALPHMWNGYRVEYPIVSHAEFLIMIGLYGTTGPFFIGLWQAFKLISYIDKNQTFSLLSLRALRNIKYCATTIGIMYMGGLPLLYPLAELEDAPGMLVIGFILACIAIVVAVFTEVVERLIQNAIEIKSENDLTI